MISFKPFRLDLAEERLWKNGQELRVRRKPFAILSYFVRNPRKLVTHEELVLAVWGKVAMSESLVRTHVRDLRSVLGEDLIETIVGRGYRFLADIAYVEPEAKVEGSESDSAEPAVVARGAELGILDAALKSAKDRRRGVVFVTGDPGIGKTALVDAFVERGRARTMLWVARGTCVEQYGSGEAFLPVLEALTNLCKARGGERVIELLSRYAPTWLAQMPALVPAARLEELQRRVAGAAQPRMLREIAEAFEALANDAPVVLVLDDLQWSDPSTLDVVAMLGRRREPARLLVVGTYRSRDLSHESALKRAADELVAHRQATSLHLEPFDEEGLGAYLAKRFPGHAFPPGLQSTIHRSTGGNPLFAVTILDDLASRGKIQAEPGGGWTLTIDVDEVAAQRPDSILRLIDTQIDRLDTVEQRILEAASVVGATFAADVVAHALDASVDEVDAACERLAEERRLLQVLGTETWPNGAIHTRFGFAHALFQHAARARNASASARLWHRRIAERLEAGYAGREEEIAAELAVHFAEARVSDKAAHFFVIAGERGAKLHAYREAQAYFERARSILDSLAESRERDDLDYREAIGIARSLLVTRGIPAPELLPAIERAIALATRLEDDTRLGAALFELGKYRIMNGDLNGSRDVAERLIAAAERAGDPRLQVASSFVSALTDLHLGRLSAAAEHLARIRDQIRDPETGSSELAIVIEATATLLSWLLGRPDEAIANGAHAMSTAEAYGDPFWIGHMLCALTVVHVWRRDAKRAEDCAVRALALASGDGLPWIAERAQPVLLWAHAELHPDPTAKDVDAWIAKPDAGRMGSTFQSAVFALACMKVGRKERALDEIAKGLTVARDSGERFVEAELHRLRGEVLAPNDSVEARRCFVKALEIAEAQGSIGFALRAALSHHRHAKGDEKRQAQAQIRRFLSLHSGGEDTRDLVDAAAAVAR